MQSATRIESATTAKENRLYDGPGNPWNSHSATILPEMRKIGKIIEIRIRIQKMAKKGGRTSIHEGLSTLNTRLYRFRKIVAQLT